MNLYECTDYKAALKGLTLDRRAQFGGKFTFEKMAAACGIQKTYLSKVLNASGHLNADQLFSAGEFLKLKPSEIDYISALREFELATNQQRKANLKIKLEKLKKETLKSDAVLQSSPPPELESHLWEYYTDIELQIVYLFLTVPTYAQNPKSICSAIALSHERLLQILMKLESWLLVKFDGKKYSTKEPNLHLPQNSHLQPVFARLARLKTLEKIGQTNLAETDDYFFTVLFSAESSFQTKFKKKFLKLLKEMQSDVIKAKSEDVFQINIDLFSWTQR